jgi:hypothetical protein
MLDSYCAVSCAVQLPAVIDTNKFVSLSYEILWEMWQLWWFWMLLRWHGYVVTGMRWCSLQVTQLACSDGGGQITQMSWVTMKDKVLLAHILDSRYHSASWIKQLLNQSSSVCFVTHALWSDWYTNQWLFFLFTVQWLISRAAFVEVPLSITKHQSDDGDTVSEILVAWILRQMSGQAGFIEYYCIVYYFLWYILFVVA